MYRSISLAFFLCTACAAGSASMDPELVPAPAIEEPDLTRVAPPAGPHGPLAVREGSPSCAEIHAYVVAECAQGTLDGCLASAPEGDLRSAAHACCESSHVPLAYCDPCRPLTDLGADRALASTCCLRDPDLPQCRIDDAVLDASALCDFFADFVDSRCAGEAETHAFSADCADRSAEDRAFTSFIGTDIHSAARACCSLGARIGETYPFCPYERGDAVTRRLPEELAPIAGVTFVRYVEILARAGRARAARIGALHAIDEAARPIEGERRIVRVEPMTRDGALAKLEPMGHDVSATVDGFYFEDVVTDFFSVAVAPDARAFIVAVEPRARVLVIELPHD